MESYTLLSLLFLVLLLNFNFIAHGQDQKEEEHKLVHSIGAGAGFSTGYGLSYRYKPGNFGGQINLAPYVDQNIKRYSLGLTFLYTLIENRFSSLYLYQGNHFYYNSQFTEIYLPYPPYTMSRERITESYMNNGLGFGLEIIIAKRIGFNIMAGYAAYKNFTQLNLTGETALYYKF